MRSTNYIKGHEVKFFEDKLANYLNAALVISCTKGTDALQIAPLPLYKQHA